MNLLLAEIGKNVAPDAHAALLVDRAGWHMTDKLVIPPNITIVPLPAKCPELNPAENVWQFLRDNWLSNRVFKSYDDIVDHCCDAWNKLIDQPWRIMSIGLRDWAHGFRSMKTGIKHLLIHLDRMFAVCWWPAPAVSKDRGLLWIGQSRAPSLARAGHEGA